VGLLGPSQVWEKRLLCVAGSGRAKYNESGSETRYSFTFVDPSFDPSRTRRQGRQNLGQERDVLDGGGSGRSGRVASK